MNSDVKYPWLLKKITKTSRVVENWGLLITASSTLLSFILDLAEIRFNVIVPLLALKYNGSSGPPIFSNLSPISKMKETELIYFLSQES